MARKETINIAAAKSRLPELVERASNGESIVIARNPFDRLLIATALTEGLVLVSADATIARYPVPLIDASK